MNTASPIQNTSFRMLDLDDGVCASKFDRDSFIVNHYLADNPLFEFSRLFELVKARKNSPEDVYWDMGDIKINQRWSETPARKLSVDEAFERIENANAWLLLRHVHKDPDYLALLESGMAEVERRCGIDFKKYVKLQDAIIFITSPGRVTSFHIDRECSFLLQIRGDKTIHVFDRNDREVLTEQELERFWSVDNNAPRYKEKYQNKATSYLLTPGKAVHIPVNAPHWLKNGDGVSISLNINFHYRDFVRADLYRANYLLRRAGLDPVPPGRNKVRDTAKRIMLGKPFSTMMPALKVIKKKVLDSRKVKSYLQAED